MENAVIEGIQRADAAANEAWKDRALLVIETIAFAQPELNTDDVWAVLKQFPETTHNLSALGPVMLKAKKFGFIEPTGVFYNSTRDGDNGKRCNAGKPIRQWRSRLYQNSLAVTA